jgi:hypothetical protein
MSGSVPRFVVKAIAWLVPAFAVWYFAAPVLLWPVRLIAQGIARVAIPDIVRAVEQSGAICTFATTLKPGQALATSGSITVDVNMLLYSFGLPLFVSLVLAAREPGWPRKLVLGYAVIVPFAAWGVLADFLKNIAITASPLVASQTGFTALQRELIAFAFQFGSLILPTVVPAVTWVVTHRAFLERLRAKPQAAAQAGEP